MLAVAVSPVTTGVWSAQIFHIRNDQVTLQQVPRVNVSVVGRFHAFDLARELQSHGLLGRLLSTYPKSVITRWGIAPDRALGAPLLEGLNRLNAHQRLIPKRRIAGCVATAIAHRARRELVGNADVFIGWTGSSLEALIAARDVGMLTILERGSSHCNEWRTLMRNENALFDQPFDEMYHFWQRELLEYVLADYISVPSSFVRDSFIKHGVPAEKMLVNAYGVDLSAFRQVEKADDVFRLIYVGGLHRRKGAHYLLQAVSELDLPGLEFWHVGSVNPEMKPFIDRYADDRFTFHGHQPQASLYKFYSQASAFVIASIEEGMAMVQCQAMACGLPLICTTNTGGADLIGEDGEGGYVVPIRDIEAFKDRIQHLYENPSLAREMGQRAKARVKQGFSWEDYGNRYISNICRILAERSGTQEEQSS